MKIGIKPSQLGLSTAELTRCWAEAEDEGFESLWTFDHLTGSLCHEAITLLAAIAALTKRVRIGCLVLIPGIRTIAAMTAGLATVDALSGGRLEVGLGAGDEFSKRDFDALGIRFPSWRERIDLLRETVDRLTELTANGSPLASQPVQSPLPLVLGGTSNAVRRMAIEHGTAWNCVTSSHEEFARLKEGQPDPQVQVFRRGLVSVGETVAQFREAGSTRLVFVLEAPIDPGDIRRLARESGL